MSKFIKEKNMETIFPYVYVALRMFLCTPASNCSTERSFSTLRRIKNYLRSTMGSERLNSLAILNIESSITKTINYDDVIKSFAMKLSRRKFQKIQKKVYTFHISINYKLLKNYELTY